jgi:AcrR family transcriptional regulator
MVNDQAIFRSMEHYLEVHRKTAGQIRGGRRERHRAETRDRLYSAALRLFAERGFLETTVEDITESADVGKGTFFNYFPTKEHVLAEFGGQRTAAVERALEKTKSTNASVLDVIGELAADTAGQSNLNAALLRAIFAAHASCAPVRNELRKRAQIGRRMLTEMFRIGQDRGEIRTDISAKDLARMMQMTFMGLTMSWAIHPESSLRKNADELWRLLCPTLRWGNLPAVRNTRADHKPGINSKLLRHSLKLY